MTFFPTHIDFPRPTHTSGALLFLHGLRDADLVGLVLCS